MIQSAGVSLSNLCELIVDCPHSTPKWTHTGVLVLRSHNIRSGRLDLSDRNYTDEDHYRHRSRRAEIRAGDLVITREAPMGEVCMIPPGLRCCLGQRMVLLRPDRRKCDPHFLLYALQSPSVQRQIGWSEGTGSTVSNLRIPHLEALCIPTPQLDEQRAVGATLASLDDKIEHNRKTSRALEGVARAIFKAWFVDFEPVKAKAAGATSFPGMPAAAFAALPTRFTDSQLGPVPEGWRVVDVYSLAKVVYGAPFKSKLFNESGDGKRLIRIRDLQTHLPTVFTPEEHPKGTIIRSGDIVVGMDGEFRLHYWTGPEAWLNQRLCSFTPLANVPAVFLGESLRGPLHFVERSEAATTVIHLGKYDIDRFELLYPSVHVLAAFGAITTPMLETVVHLAAESRKLAELRDYLLPKLLSGEVRVAEAESTIARDSSRPDARQ